MSNTLKIILFSLLVFILILGNILFFSKTNNLENQLKQVRQLEQRMQGETESLSKDKAKLSEEKEKLQSDAASYLAINEKLQSEKESFRVGLEKAQKSLDTKESEMERLKKELQKIEEKIAKEHTGMESKAEKEAKELKKKIYLMDKKVKGEQALYHYNLGVAFTQAKRYDAAVGEYEKSLELNPDNADAHYNLALIYDGIIDSANKAVFHYRAYLNLRKNAPDRDEVESAIKHLK